MSYFRLNGCISMNVFSFMSRHAHFKWYIFIIFINKCGLVDFISHLYQTVKSHTVWKLILSSYCYQFDIKLHLFLFIVNFQICTTFILFILFYFWTYIHRVQKCFILYVYEHKLKWYALLYKCVCST